MASAPATQPSSLVDKTKQLHFFVRRALNQRRVDLRLKFCVKCSTFSMTYTATVTCLTKSCGRLISAEAPDRKVPCRIYFLCPSCDSLTNLNCLSNVWFFICLECFFRPRFGANCFVKLIPLFKRLDGCVINLPSEGLLMQRQPSNCISLALSIWPLFLDKDPNTIYFPSKAISSAVWNSLVAKEREFVVTDAWACNYCFSLNEFEYAKWSPCVFCNNCTDTSNFTSFLLGVQRFVTTVSFSICCSLCSRQNTLAQWTTTGRLACPEYHCLFRFAKQGQVLKIVRTVQPCEVFPGYFLPVHSLGSNIWYYTLTMD